MVMQQLGLSNLQHELLKLYGNNISDDALFEIKGILARFFANRASDAMDDVWDKDGLSPEDVAAWADEHNRVEDRP